jgi:hypothetical protein
VVTRIGEKFGGIRITIPAEPMIAGAVGAALFAFDPRRQLDSAAGKEGASDCGRISAGKGERG